MYVNVDLKEAQRWYAKVHRHNCENSWFMSLITELVIGS
jgi:hypothetical protein